MSTMLPDNFVNYVPGCSTWLDRGTSAFDTRSCSTCIDLAPTRSPGAVGKALLDQHSRGVSANLARAIIRDDEGQSGRQIEGMVGGGQELDRLGLDPSSCVHDGLEGHPSLSPDLTSGVEPGLDPNREPVGDLGQQRVAQLV